jgi:hypothetical protein
VGGALATTLDHQQFNLGMISANALGSAIGQSIGSDIKNDFQNKAPQTAVAYKRAQQDSVNGTQQSAAQSQNSQNPGRNRSGFFAGSKNDNQSSQSQQNQGATVGVPSGSEDRQSNNKGHSWLDESPKQGALSTAERVGEKAESMYSDYKGKYDEHWNAGTEAYKDARALDDGYTKTIEQTSQIAKTESMAISHMNAAAKYGFYSAASKGLSFVGKAGTTAEVLVAGYKVTEAQPGQKLRVGVEQTGEIGAGYGGRLLGAAGAEGLLLTVGSALEFVPGPGTILGTTIIGGTLGGVAAVSLYNEYEPRLENDVEENFDNDEGVNNNRFGW